MNETAKNNVSIIIPFHNEAECVAKVISELHMLRPNDEIVAIDDGSTDGTLEILRSFNDVVTIPFSAHSGQSAAIWHGLQTASHEICVIIDGDGECDPNDIDKFIVTLSECDFVCGYRVDRKRSVAHVVASRVANVVRKLVTGDNVRDTVAMKAIKKSHTKHLIPFDGMHRFIPLNSRLRISGHSKYSIYSRARAGLFDLIGVRWLIKRRITQRHINTPSIPHV